MTEETSTQPPGWFERRVVDNRVTLGFAAAVVFLVVACPTRASVFWGFWVAVAGEAVRTWSSGTIVKNKVLATEGPYRLTRNPLYVGSFLISVGVGIMGGRWWLPVLAGGLFLVVYRGLILKEEIHLKELYPEDFPAYCAEVPRFFPRILWPLPTAPYDVKRMWRKHKEWQAWLGLYAVTLYLLLRA